MRLANRDHGRIIRASSDDDVLTCVEGSLYLLNAGERDDVACIADNIGITHRGCIEWGQATSLKRFFDAFLRPALI